MNVYNFHLPDVISHPQDNMTVLFYVLCQKGLNYSLGLKDSPDRGGHSPEEQV